VKEYFKGGSGRIMMEEKFNFKKGNRGRSIFRICNVLILSIVMISMILPLLKIVSDSLDTSGQYGMNFIPKSPSFEAYKVIFTNPTMYKPFFVSVYTTVIGTTLGLLITTMAAYVLIQKDMPGNRFLVWTILFTMIFNGGIVPTYLTMKNLHLLDSLWAVILPLSFVVYNIILMKNFFDGIPGSLFEAAEIDGCSPMRIFWQIVLPLSKPAIASIGLFFGVEYWNHFFNFVMYITNRDLINFQMKLRELVLSSTNLSNANSGESSVYAKTIQNAVVIISMLPPMIVYPMLQKYFVTGVTMGAVKE
jgi:putative aldouronate transport system permease protein